MAIDFHRALNIQKYFHFKTEISWKSVIVLAYLHASVLYGLYLVFTGHVRILTVIFAYAMMVVIGFGITAGAHRLWAHRAYKAKLPLRVLLMFLNSMSFQNSIYEWARDHRLHHKHTETDADPHSYARGFFFAHIGWLMLRKHPEVKIKGKGIDMSDLEQDEVVMFQKRNYWWLMPLCTFVIPTFTTHYVMQESLLVSWYIGGILRYMLSMHLTWSINSFAHYIGSKPYDKNIAAANNTYIGILLQGEGWHNYHHVFPWDYKTSELNIYHLNWTNAFIDFFAKIGLAYDLKSVSEKMIKARTERTGDGIPYKYTKCVVPGKSSTVDNHSHEHTNLIWGWDDKDLDQQDKQQALIYNKEKLI